MDTRFLANCKSSKLDPCFSSGTVLLNGKTSDSSNCGPGFLFTNPLMPQLAKIQTTSWVAGYLQPRPSFETCSFDADTP